MYAKICHPALAPGTDQRVAAEKLRKIRYGEESVLLVEDEVKIRQVVVSILESYEVHGVTGGGQAGGQAGG